jgi:hypothetical protein
LSWDFFARHSVVERTRQQPIPISAGLGSRHSG